MSMPDSRLAALPPPLQRAAEYLRRHYDMNVHTRVDADHTAGVDDAFVDWFALAGPVARVLPRVRRCWTISAPLWRTA